jgi:hypothetical protein
MAFTVTHGLDSSSGDHVVTVRVGLSLSETNSLFLSGDTIVSWPEGRLFDDQSDRSALPDQAAGFSNASETGLVRTGMFISELAHLAQGLRIGYRQSADAERSAQLIRLQLRKAGIEEEA